MINNNIINNNGMNDTEIISTDILEGLGISEQSMQEIEDIFGRKPTMDELGTLLAMWHAQGGRQGLLSWLRGQPHSAERHDYLENAMEPQSREIREPRVRECIEIARHLFADSSTLPAAEPLGLHRGDAIYMIGDVSVFFSASEYGRRFLHLVADPIALNNEEETGAYLAMILESLESNGIIFAHKRIEAGGLFGTLLQSVAPQSYGFDILTCREVRLDAFLFGESGVRHVAFLDEPHEDFLLQKLVEARVNCCFLGRVTKGRLLVDDMDFGPVGRYMPAGSSSHSAKR